jgi:hypothetical protein
MHFLAPLLAVAALARATVLPTEEDGPTIHTFASAITDGGARHTAARKIPC